MKDNELLFAINNGEGTYFKRIGFERLILVLAQDEYDNMGWNKMWWYFIVSDQEWIKRDGYKQETVRKLANY